jgi:hypothetical protein
VPPRRELFELEFTRVVGVECGERLGDVGVRHLHAHARQHAMQLRRVDGAVLVCAVAPKHRPHRLVDV